MSTVVAINRRETLERLKQNNHIKSFVTRKEANVPAKLGYRSGTKMCIERMRWLTRSYRETEGQPEVLRRAKALEKILDNLTIFILDGERIVGNCTCDIYSIPVYPDIVNQYRGKYLDEVFPQMIKEGEEEEFRELLRYWDGKAVGSRVRAVIPDDVKGYVDWNGTTITNHFEIQNGAYTPNYETLFRLGLEGIIEEAKNKLDQLRASSTALR